MFRQVDRSRVLIAILLTASAVFWSCCSAVAQDEVSETPTTEQPANEVESSDAQTNSSLDSDSKSTQVAGLAPRTIDEKERLRESARKSAMAGLLVLSLICIVFLVLIVLVALWARRIRMLTQQPLPDQQPGDPLWYLRKGKGSDASDGARLADGGVAHGDS